MKQKKFGILKQISVLAFLMILIVGVITYLVQYRLSEESVVKQTGELAQAIAEEVKGSVKQYPAYEWLMRCWYENADTLDIEYDVDYETGTETKEKYARLNARHPGFRARYATSDEVKALPEEDQKLYAEIVYSWLITRVNQIKQNYDVDYLFCVLTDMEGSPMAYQEQFFLFSGADEGAVRGTNYLEVYPLGTIVSVAENKSQQEVMRHAVRRVRAGKAANVPLYELAFAGDYVDYYSFLGTVGNKAVLVGLTYDLSSLRKDVRRQTWKATFYAVLFEIILLQLIMWHLVFFEIRPLKNILENILLYTRTKDSKTIETNLKKILTGKAAFAIRKNEVGELAEDVMHLAREVDDYIDQIETATAKNERIEAELSLAARIQADMLPSVFPPFPDRKEFDLYASMNPAREVGGDFYNFFLLDEDHLVILIADVSGKGIPAALFMMVSQIVIRNMTQAKGSPAKALEAVNEEICGHNLEQMFVTVWLGILQISTGLLKAANAGHEYPVYKAAGMKFDLLKDVHGFVIGGLDGVKYKEYEIQMQPGSKIFLYTDGVPEAVDEHSEFFGAKRMLKALNNNPEADARQTIGNVRKELELFVGETEQFDDITMLCLEYSGTGTETA